MATRVMIPASLGVPKPFGLELLDADGLGEAPVDEGTVEEELDPPVAFAYGDWMSIRERKKRRVS